MLDLVNVQAPIETANGLPNACYIDPIVYRHEQDTLFCDNWVAVGFGKDVPKPGCVKPVNFASLPLLIVRNYSGKIKVFFNVCRHRGMILVDKAQQLRGPITCPYHAWAYDFDGVLRKTPHVGGPDIHEHPSVQHCDYPLTTVRSHTWNDVVFVNIGGGAPKFSEYASDLISRWSEFDKPMYHGGDDSSLEFTLACNWKLAVENFCDSYHLPFIHPTLNSYSRLQDHYHIMDKTNLAGQGTKVYSPQMNRAGTSLPNFSGLSTKWDHGAEYIALFPNVLLGIHRDHYFAIVLTPEGLNQTTEQIEIYYASSQITTPEYADTRATVRSMWHDIFFEDIAVVEGMQEGRYCPRYDGGKFSAAMDGPTYHFHKWVAKALSNSNC